MEIRSSSSPSPSSRLTHLISSANHFARASVLFLGGALERRLFGDHIACCFWGGIAGALTFAFDDDDAAAIEGANGGS